MTTTPRVHWWTSLALLSLGGLMAVVFFGAQKSLPVISRPSEDANILRLACVQNLSPDPQRRTSPYPAHNHFILSLWEPLIECDPATGQPQPAAAQSWEWSPDRLTLTLKLRPDARWSNGEPVSAHDFIRSWRRLLGQPIELAQTLFPLKNAEAFHLGHLKDFGAVGMQAVDGLTLRLELSKVRSSLVAELADPLLSPLPEGSEQILADASFFRDPTALVTNGPFRLQRADYDGFRLLASPHYHGSRDVRLAGLRFIRVDYLALGQLLLAAGVVDIVSPMSYEERRLMPTERQVKYEHELVLGVTTLDFNVSRGPLRDIRVRQALALALDRSRLTNKFNPGRMVPAWSWIPSMPGRPGLNLLKKNAEEARRLLAAAGYPAGRGFPVLEMSLPLWQRDNPYPAEWVETWYQELGVRTHISHEPVAVRAKRMTAAGDYDLLYSSMVATVPDAGDLLSGFLWPSEINATKWVDKKMIGLLNEANTLTGERRLAALEKAEQLLMTAVPNVPVMFERRQAMLAAEVQGWYPDPLARQSLRRLWLEPALANNSRREPGL